MHAWGELATLALAQVLNRNTAQKQYCSRIALTLDYSFLDPLNVKKGMVKNQGHRAQTQMRTVHVPRALVGTDPGLKYSIYGKRAT